MPLEAPNSNIYCVTQTIQGNSGMKSQMFTGNQNKVVTTKVTERQSSEAKLMGS